MTHRVALLVGSLRKGSFTRRVAEAAVKLSPGGATYENVAIGELPFFNQDLDDAGAPAAWTAFRQKIKTFDGVLFATPEYNRSIPAALKNALDVGSRPFGQNVWNGKPAGILSVSPGNLGGFGANHHLRQVLTFLNMPAMAQPEAYVGGAAKLIDDSGQFTIEASRDFLRTFITAFEAWVARLAPLRA